MPFQSGTQTKDHSGEGNDGTITGATYNVTGGYDGFGAYEFDGDGDKISTSTFFDIGAEGTISTWFKLKETKRQGIIQNNYRPLVYAHNIGRLEVYHSGATFSVRGDEYITPANTLSLNSWQFVAYSWKNNDTYELYLNGTLLENGTVTGATSPGAGTLEIGTYLSTNWFNGTIDEVMIWNRSLSAEEIKRLYKKRRIETGFLDDVTFGGDVGIGTTNPTHTLNVVGDANITGDAIIEGDMAAKNLPQEPFNAGDMYVCWDATDGSLFLNETGC
jgi:hypothetical protein